MRVMKVSLKGIDARILNGAGTGWHAARQHWKTQLREQKALDKFDQSWKKFPRVREDLGFIPLVTPQPRRLLVLRHSSERAYR